VLVDRFNISRHFLGLALLALCLTAPPVAADQKEGVLT
jgi:hypothetical protein